MATKNSSSKKTSAKKGKDAIALLKEDHKKVRGLLDRLEKTTGRGAAQRTKLLTEIEKEIKVHSKIEEEIFYPAYKAAAVKSDDKQVFFEAVEEHRVVDMVLPDCKAADPATEVFGARAKVLKEIIEHHAGEEEKDMFKKARRLLSAAELQDLGSRMAARKKQLLDGGAGPSRKAAEQMAGELASGRR